MSERHADWLRQAKRDLFHARNAEKDGCYEWSCFAAQQGAEKAVKAVYQRLGAAGLGTLGDNAADELARDISSTGNIGRPSQGVRQALHYRSLPQRI